MNGYEAVEGLLLNISAIDVNIRNDYGETALHFATKNSHEAVERLMISVPRIDPHVIGRMFDKSPLYYAAVKGYEVAAKLLITIPGIDLDIRDRFRHPPIFVAKSVSNVATTQILLEFEGNDYNAGLLVRALPVVTRGGYEGIVKLLLKGLTLMLVIDTARH
ncbi:hypothetical protein ETB97_010380 [Aspergillus alliaceus]|uniref:Ankyrin repeat-containing domain protein n=1 Tax=Petromyces alliaceus TaxID=209559 RepID=A0A8H6A5N6_PETAA|nr:hypothetical protein ETB97_010380 [Aspergillus burnettii]